MTFNPKNWSAHVNPTFTIVETDVEASVQAYLAQFAHKGCGGAPVKGVGVITCGVCGQKWNWSTGTLGDMIRKIPFRSLKV